MRQPVVGANQASVPWVFSWAELVAHARQGALAFCFPLAGVPALPPLQTSPLLEDLSCRTVFFHQD